MLVRMVTGLFILQCHGPKVQFASHWFGARKIDLAKLGSLIARGNLGLFQAPSGGRVPHAADQVLWHRC